MYRLGLGASLQYPAIDAAIAQFETGGSPTAVGNRNNNPGNLVFSSWESQFGCTAGGSGGFALCPTPEAGQAILDYRVSQLVSQGDSISELLDVWASPTYPGNTQASYDNYVASVAAATGLDPNSPISGQSPTVDTSAGETFDTTDLASSSPNWTIIGLGVGVLALALVAFS